MNLLKCSNCGNANPHMPIAQSGLCLWCEIDSLRAKVTELESAMERAEGEYAEVWAERNGLQITCRQLRETIERTEQVSLVGDLLGA